MKDGTLEQILNKYVPSRAQGLYDYLKNTGGEDTNSAIPIYSCACVLANLIVDGTSRPDEAWLDVQKYIHDTMVIRRREKIKGAQ